MEGLEIQGNPLEYVEDKTFNFLIVCDCKTALNSVNSDFPACSH